MAFNNFPYTDFHALNLDWLLEKMRQQLEEMLGLSVKFDELRAYVEGYLQGLDLTDVVNDKLEEMAADGTFQNMVAQYIQGAGYVNLAWFAPGGELTGDNFATALNNALTHSSYVYVPAGDYAIHAEITRDCHLLLDAHCRITPNNEISTYVNRQGVSSTVTFALQAVGCSVSIHGGTIYQGVSPAPYWTPGQYNLPTGTRREPNIFRAGKSDPRFNRRISGIVRFFDCHDIEISGVDVPYSDNGGVFLFTDCENVSVHDCSFDYLRANAIRFVSTCRNVEVKNCSFKHAYFAMGDSDSNWYIPPAGEPVYIARFCYFVTTGLPGLKGTSDPEGIYYGIEPVDGLRYINNHCESSEDSGLDTHGARNVIIDGNTIIDTVCAITAYNDNLRAVRPLGWQMSNVTISNNYCHSTRQRTSDPHVNAYPHPFVFLGSPLNRTMEQAGSEWNFQPTDWHSYSNCAVKNNIFKSVNGKPAMVAMSSNSFNVSFENNVFEFLTEEHSTITTLVNCGAATFINNSSNVVSRLDCRNSVVDARGNGLMRLVKVAPIVQMKKAPVGPYTDIGDAFEGGEALVRYNSLWRCAGYLGLMLQEYRFNGFSDDQKRTTCAHAYVNPAEAPAAYKSIKFTVHGGGIFWIPGLSVRVLYQDGTLRGGYVTRVDNRNEVWIAVNTSPVSGGPYTYPPLPAGSTVTGEQPVYPVEGIEPAASDNCYIYPRLYDNTVAWLE